MRAFFSLLVCAAALVPARAQSVPRPSPAFEIQRVGKPPLPLKSFRGKIVALAFIDTNCPHCQDLTRNLVPIAREYAPRGVQFLECAFNGDARTSVSGFIQRFDPPFPVGWSDRAAVMAYLQYSILDPRPMYVPHMVFIGRHGTIRGDFPGESDFFKNPEANIRAELNTLLAAPSRTTGHHAPVHKTAAH